MQDNHNDVKYEVATGGATAVWVVPHLIKTIQAAICKKTSNRMVQERIDNYHAWWLVVTDPNYSRGLTLDEARAIADAIHYSEPWRNILLADTQGNKVNAVHSLTRVGS